MSRRSVAGFAFMTSFRQDRCDSFSARDPQAGSDLYPRVRHLFEATRSRLVLFQEGKGSQSPRLTAHALHGDVERTRCAVGSGVTLHVAAFFPRWRDGVRCGHCSTCPWLPIQSLFHRGLVVTPNKCEGIRAKPTPPDTDDLGLPKSQGRVSVPTKLRGPCSAHVISLK